MSEKTLILIDGNSLVNRAFYAIQRPMVTKDGIFTQGIYGFVSMLNKLLADYEPGYIAVMFDRSAPTFRHEEYDEYKAGRRKMPMELAMEFPYLKEVLAARNIAVYEIDGFEADDLIGTAAKRGEEAGLEPLIVTGDRDALQLATDTTKIVFTKRGISEFDLYDAAVIREKYGFGPELITDYKGLMGDSSDNIPGIPGVGEKTAAKLILQFGTVENLIEHADEIANEKLREKTEDYAQQALMSKRLATIITDVPIEMDFADMRLEEPDRTALAEIYTKLEFRSFLKKLDLPAEAAYAARTAHAAGPASGGAPDTKHAAAAPAYFDGEVVNAIIRDAAGLAQAAADMTSEGLLALKVFGDNNHKSKPRIDGIACMTRENYWYISVGGDDGLTSILVDTLVDAGTRLIGHGLQRDVYMLRGACGEKVEKIEIAFDSAVSRYVLDPTVNNDSLKLLAASYFGREVRDEEEFVKQNAQMDMLSDAVQIDADYGREYLRAVISLMPVMTAEMEAGGFTDLWERVERPLIAPLAAMESEGFTFDETALEGVGGEVDRGIEELTASIHELAGEQFNINSPQQLGVILFERLGLPFAKKTQRGYATGADILEKLAETYPIAEDILAYRTLAKLRSTYIEGLKPCVAVDGKIHAHFKQTVTATGRISCTEPNLQNIPIRQEFGRRIRKAFIPSDSEHILIGADYSQIELRILAHFSGDPALLEDFRQGADIHKRTASRVFGVPEDGVTPLMRSGAKAVNFGIIYGMSGFGLSEGLGITRGEAERYIEDYFRGHQAVKNYLDECVESAKETGYAETIMGRRRFIPEMNASNRNVRMLGERLAMNTPLQGSAADIIKLAMIRVAKLLKEAGLASRIILQVHDELILEAPVAEKGEAARLLKEGMEGAIELKAPLLCEVAFGTDWFELK
ncbi:MAG: DNA polymerase I [Clostridiales Family XIII bacterium]|jgi:DNA polymerase-1|nr:DNA polymerase I [Clostridiales Family XIII bacterium]